MEALGPGALKNWRFAALIVKLHEGPSSQVSLNYFTYVRADSLHDVGKT